MSKAKIVEHSSSSNAPIFVDVYLCPNMLQIPNVSTNVYFFPNVRHFYKCIFVPQYAPLCKCASPLHIYICAPTFFLFSQLSIIDLFVHYRLKNTVKFTVKVMLFCFSSRVLYYTADVSRNTNHGHNHYLVPLFKSFIQALHAYQAKGKVNICKMVEASHPNVST